MPSASMRSPRRPASKLTIYKNFGSKDGLVEAVLTDRAHRVRAWHEQAVEQAESGRDRILAVSTWSRPGTPKPGSAVAR